MNTRVRRQSNSGFTIVETLIFLGVTAVMLVSALLLVGGQQRKTEFTQAIRDIESQIKDVANDVSTGYYSRSSNFTCEDRGAPRLVISTGISSLGTNSDCIFIGRALQFKVEASNGEGFAIYNIAGKRGTNSLSDAKVTALAPVPGNNRPSSVDSKNLLYGLRVDKMTNGSGVDIYGFAFVSRLSAGTSTVASGIIPVDVIPLGSTETDQQRFANEIDGIGAAGVDENSNSGISICFVSGGTDQHAILTIGANDSLETNVEIKSGTGC